MDTCPHGARLRLEPGKDVQFIDDCVSCQDLLAEIGAQRVPEDEPALV